MKGVCGMTYTDEEKMIVINRLDEGNSIKAICNEYGVARSTLYCPYLDRRTGKTVVNWKGKGKNHGTEKDKKGDAPHGATRHSKLVQCVW